MTFVKTKNEFWISERIQKIVFNWCLILIILCYHTFYLCLWHFYIWFFICFIKLWGHQVWDIEVFVPSHTFTYNRILCTHSHREAVTPAIGNLGEASRQLSWGENLRMGSWNTSTQIEPFSFVACNGWGSGCLLVPRGRQWRIFWEPLESSNLEISTVIQSQP